MASEAVASPAASARRICRVWTDLACGPEMYAQVLTQLSQAIPSLDPTRTSMTEISPTKSISLVAWVTSTTCWLSVPKITRNCANQYY